jgi:2-oxoglutarate/2-oxoacid ferredoxin oxidoreductase subunit alpha
MFNLIFIKMRLNFLIGGEAGQGINKISKIASKILTKLGYFTFNYRDYQSLIRGGHNFNILSISEKEIFSSDKELDGIIALDKRTIELHKKDLRKSSFILDGNKFLNLKKNINIALLGSFMSLLGIEKEFLVEIVKKEFKDKKAIEAVKTGFDLEKNKFNLKKLENKINLIDGSEGVVIGAINSNLEIYIAYPMTPATGVMKGLAKEANKKRLKVFQAENEIAVINSGLGASFAGSTVMIGTSGGGFDLMSEGLSFQGMSKIPLVVYLAMRSGPGTGIPTYTSQADLNIALRAGHGEFPRIVIAPGDALECIEKTNEAFYFSQKFNCLSIILSDKHIAESTYSFSKDSLKFLKFLKISKNRKIPGIKNYPVKVSGYEHDKYGNTIEDEETAIKNAELRIKEYKRIKEECREFETFKLYGKKENKNLIVGWGSTKGAIKDIVEEENSNCRFLQIIYLKPMSDKIKKILEKSKNIILVENNSTGQLGRLLREKTGIKIPEENRILKYDARPFSRDKLKKEIKKRLK